MSGLTNTEAKLLRKYGDEEAKKDADEVLGPEVEEEKEEPKKSRKFVDSVKPKENRIGSGRIEKMKLFIKIASVSLLGYVILEIYDTTKYKNQINGIIYNRFNIILL